MNQANNHPNYAYDLEQVLIQKMLSGNTSFAQHDLSSLLHQFILSQAPNDWKRQQSLSIMLVTLISESSLKGGLNPESARNMAITYLGKIESAQTTDALLSVLEAIILTYTNKITLKLKNNHHAVIKKVTHYIQDHLSQPILLKDIATYVGLSPNYLSTLFKREMSMSLADYMNQIRINESQILLETTSDSILEIALQTGFKNQNYFTTIFRKHTGTTPKQYRLNQVQSNR